MATAADFREVVLRVSATAAKSAPANRDERLYAFVFRLAVALGVFGEPELDAALMGLLDDKPKSPVTAAPAHAGA
jgi:hypothetical protein